VSSTSALVTSAGHMLEWVKYSPYGIPFGLPAGDTNSDGDCDNADLSTISGWASGYDTRADLNIDGGVDSADSALTITGIVGGYRVLAAATTGNTRGLAGSVLAFSSSYHMRRRYVDSTMGVWLTRDPLGYADGSSLYWALANSPVSNTDAMGLKVQFIQPGGSYLECLATCLRSGSKKFDDLMRKLEASSNEHTFALENTPKDVIGGATSSAIFSDDTTSTVDISDSRPTTMLLAHEAKHVEEALDDRPNMDNKGGDDDPFVFDSDVQTEWCKSGNCVACMLCAPPLDVPTSFPPWRWPHATDYVIHRHMELIGTMDDMYGSTGGNWGTPPWLKYQP